MDTCKCETNILSSTATATISGSILLIVPSTELPPLNEQRIKIKITGGVPAAAATLPVQITLNGANVTLYNKFGNLVYGNQIYDGQVLKGYFGNNGSGATSHFQLIKFPIRYYCC